MSLFAELKRRKVFKVGAAYLVVAWLLVQVASTLAPQLTLPDWVPRLVTFGLLLGFPLALVLAWVFESTPEGMRVDAAPAGHKRMAAIALVLVAIAVGWFWKGRPAPVDADAALRTIAVLPFVNMSGDPENEYFSDGISEEILNVLASTPDLRVAARTSSFAFKGQQKEIPDIARELAVRLVLEGSVRRQGDRVRITAQLIDAQEGFQLWSQAYDRKLEDIFAIQDEIARAIGSALQLQIGGGTPRAAANVGGGSVEAYDLHLRGVALWQQRREQSLWEAAALFERAVAADPEFAPAHGGLALVFAVIGPYSKKISRREAHARARDHAEVALALDPGLPEAYAALGLIAQHERRWSTGQRLLRRAIVLRPSFATAHQWLGSILLLSGDPEAGLAALEQAVALDPRSRVSGHNHAWALAALGREAEARAACQRVLDFAPDYDACLEFLAVSALLRGEIDLAAPLLDRLATTMDLGGQAAAKELVEAFAGRGDRDALARRLTASDPLDHLVAGSGVLLGGLQTPAVLVGLGRNDLAIGFLERITAMEADDAGWALVAPDLDAIRCDPRIIAAFERRNARDPRAERLCAGKS